MTSGQIVGKMDTQNLHNVPLQVVVVTDGMPYSKHLTTEAVANLKKAGARVVFVTVGSCVNRRVVDSWASWPRRENVVAVDTFAKLNTDKELTGILANLCPLLAD